MTTQGRQRRSLSIVSRPVLCLQSRRNASKQTKSTSTTFVSQRSPNKSKRGKLYQGKVPIFISPTMIKKTWVAEIRTITGQQNVSGTNQSLLTTRTLLSIQKTLSNESKQGTSPSYGKSALSQHRSVPMLETTATACNNKIRFLRLNWLSRVRR